jgi:CHAD domain-containing protein
LPNDLPDENSIKSYFKKKIHKAKKKLHSQERSDLHRFRKIIKELVFVYQSLPGKLQNKVKFDKKCMDIIQKKVGRWHDAYTALNYLAHQPVSSESDHFISMFKEEEIFLFRRALKQAKGFVHVIGMLR